MNQTVDKLAGIRVSSQSPLDVKSYVLNEATLKDLGPSNNLAYTYHKGLEVTCIAERTKYEWKEMEAGDVGLLPIPFTYPSGIVAFGIDYSNKIYNFVKIVVKEDTVVPEPVVFNQNNIVKQILIPEQTLFLLYGKYSTEEAIALYILDLPKEERTILETTSKVNVIITGSDIIKIE